MVQSRLLVLSNYYYYVVVVMVVPSLMLASSSGAGIHAFSPPSPSSHSSGRMPNHRILNPPIAILSSFSRQKQQQKIQEHHSLPSHRGSISGGMKRRASTFLPTILSSSALPSSSSSSEVSTRPPSWIQCLTGVSHPQRPTWARDWMPTWLVRLRPSLQLLTVLVAYIFHMTVLAQRSISFPFQLIPNDRGHFQTIGWDSIAGIVTVAAYYWFRATTPEGHEESLQWTPTTNRTNTLLPNLWSTPSLSEVPWKNIYRSNNNYARLTSFVGLCALVQAYFWTGRFSLWWEDTFFYLANFYPITVAMHRSLCVLFGHLSWIVLGGSVLRLIPRPQSFFENTWYTQRYRRQPSNHGNSNNEEDSDEGAPQWVWWTIGGYFVSSWLFNIADVVNQWVLPIAILEQAQESVVSQLINPESNDWWASFVGYIAPCITAPWWEEVLYRGFLLPALVLQMKYKWAVLWSGIIFAVHHLSPTACIPLTILGWTWSILYVKSGNLLTTIIIHAMWNSRIFLGSWLGL